MARTIKLQNVAKTALGRMDEKEITAMVEKLADQMLRSLPEELKVSDINSIQLESSLKEVAADGVWAQWTRACCDKRRDIADFIDPVISELAVNTPQIERAVFQDHFDTNFVVKKVTEPNSLKKIEKRNLSD
ncbi:MAG: hypothetical protein ACK587_04255 [Cyanobacteriota bacterium]